MTAVIDEMMSYKVPTLAQMYNYITENFVSPSWGQDEEGNYEIYCADSSDDVYSVLAIYDVANETVTSFFGKTEMSEDNASGTLTDYYTGDSVSLATGEEEGTIVITLSDGTEITATAAEASIEDVAGVVASVYPTDDEGEKPTLEGASEEESSTEEAE